MAHTSRLLSDRARLIVCATVLLGVGFASGCAPRVYRAAQLPTEFAAAPAVDLDSLDLSGLAGPAGSRDVICWGDLLVVEIDAGLPELEPRVSSIRVAKDGSAKVPLIGCVAVAGMEVEQAEAAVIDAARSRGIYPNPHVSVKITSPRKNRVTVVGAVKEPGECLLARDASSLMAAIVGAGGLDENAEGTVEIRHTNPHLAATGPNGAPGMGEGNGIQTVSYEAGSEPGNGVVRINLIDAANSEAGKRALNDGDVVNVVARELPPVHVLGLVREPGDVEMTANRDVRLLDALAMAKGVSNPVADRVTIRRIVPGQAEPVTIVASVRKASDGRDNLLLAPGDTVIVRQTAQTVVVDVVSTFVRVGIGGTMGVF